MSNSNCKWFIIIKYRQEDYCGEMIDAIFAPTSVDALYIVTRGPVKPGEHFRAFEAMGRAQTNTAIVLHQTRRKADREWKLLMEHIEESWARASENRRSASE